jgi:hypothetical protein
MTANADLAKATSIRKKENDAFLEDTSEFRSNIEAMDSAIVALNNGAGKGQFLQNKSFDKSRLVAMMSTGSQLTGLDRHDKIVLQRFLQQSSTSPYGAYSSQTGQIVGILEQMKERMDEDLGGVLSREDAQAATFKDMESAKKKEIQAHTDAIESKQVRSGSLGVSIVSGKGDIENTKKELGDTQKFLLELGESCKTKTGEYQERTKTRTDELSAISEAVKILNDDDSLEVFSNTLQKPKSASLFQKGQHANKAKRASNLVLLLVSQNHMTSSEQSDHSSQLKLIASLIASSSSKADFSKIFKMIDAMVELLQTEQVDDSTHRDWCRVEFDSNEDNTKDTQRKLASVSAFIDEATEKVSGLSEEITMSEEEVSQLDKAVAEATEQRKKEKEEFVLSQTERGAAVALI